MRVKEEEHIHPTHLTLPVHSVSSVLTHQQLTRFYANSSCYMHK